MIGLVMAGGKGTRMKIDDEKLLLNYKKPVIMHVIDALENSACFEKISAITSPNSPKTKNYLKENSVNIIETKGNGYSEDLSQILQQTDDHVFVCSGDLPFLDGEIIKTMIAKYNPNNIWTSFVITKGFLESLGLSSEFSVTFENHDCHYTGISLINAKNIHDNTPIKENYLILDDKRIAFNLNTKQDFELLSTT